MKNHSICNVIYYTILLKIDTPLMPNPHLVDSQSMLNPPRTEEEARIASLTSPRLNRAEILDVSSNPHVAADVSAYRSARIDVKDAIAFAALKMKDIYDSHHKPMFFEEGDQVNLRLYRGYHVPAITSKKIDQQLVGPFRVLKPIGRLAYQLDLPAYDQCHLTISACSTASAHGKGSPRRRSIDQRAITGVSTDSPGKCDKERRVERFSTSSAG